RDRKRQTLEEFGACVHVVIGVIGAGGGCTHLIDRKMAASRVRRAMELLIKVSHGKLPETLRELPSSPGGQFTFRPLPPPPPPPHACTCARPAPYTQVSLQRKTMPTRCQASQGGQGGDTSSSTDQAQLHNSWVLNSNIPLETRHFLFKQGSGSSALLSGAGQGYPLTSGTVYSPPPRPLPRSSVTRPLFTFNKPHRCCNWKCTALSASLLTLTLALLLTYVIEQISQPSTQPLHFPPVVVLKVTAEQAGTEMMMASVERTVTVELQSVLIAGGGQEAIACHIFAAHLGGVADSEGLTWHLRHGESQLYENGVISADHQQEDRSKPRPTSSIHLLDTLNPENAHAGDRGELTRVQYYTTITDVPYSTIDRICPSVATKPM
ncbi:Teneurin-1, partial [Dissostichus eleginoides]